MNSLAVITLVSCIYLIINILYIIWLRIRKEKDSVCIVVLGDIGRSPRMQYQAISFAKQGFLVHLIGYPGSEPLKKFREYPNVRIEFLKASPDLTKCLSRLVSLAIKAIWQSINLLLILLIKCRSSHLMIQNPPAIPTIPICWLFCYLSSTKFAIDWHNYAYTIMAMNLGENHFLVKLTRLIEFWSGKRANFNFCVTRAMQDNLKNEWNIEAKVLYDRPSERFRPITVEEKHAFFVIMSKYFDVFKGDNESCTAFSWNSPTGEIQMRPDRPALLVSSTSWTQDEDFSILLNALEEYEAACQKKKFKLPKMICIITGKGPLRDFYTAIIENKKWENVTILTPWFGNEEYPKVLGSADLGVCLHTSSSGLDLPMKVVDMFGCGLPVCAYNYKSLHELVRHEENSLVFSDEKELATQLKTWFNGFPNSPTQKEKYGKFREHLEKFRLIGWHGNWSITVLPCFEQ